MKSRQRIMRACVMAAVFVLGGACSKIETPKHAVSRQTEAAVMAVAPAETGTAAFTPALTTTTIPTTTTTSATTTITTTTTTTTTTVPMTMPAPSVPAGNADIDPSLPMVALTFDDGPGGYTNDILDTLETYNARATFFVIGRNINDETALVIQRAVSTGCEIGNHTYDHSDLTKDTPEQFQTAVQQGNDRIYAAVGYYPRWLRPPYGAFDDNVQRHVGMGLAYWSIDTKDWKTRDTAATVTAVLQTVEDGDVILMHDIYPETAAAAAQIVPSLVQQGYQLVTLSEMTDARGLDVGNGMVVFSMHPDKPRYKAAPCAE